MVAVVGLEPMPLTRHASRSTRGVMSQTSHKHKHKRNYVTVKILCLRLCLHEAHDITPLVLALIFALDPFSDDTSSYACVASENQA